MAGGGCSHDGSQSTRKAGTQHGRVDFVCQLTGKHVIPAWYQPGIWCCALCFPVLHLSFHSEPSIDSVMRCNTPTSFPTFPCCRCSDLFPASISPKVAEAGERRDSQFYFHIQPVCPRTVEYGGRGGGATERRRRVLGARPTAGEAREGVSRNRGKLPSELLGVWQ